MNKTTYIVEVERNGIRQLYGPVPNIQEARAVAEHFLALRQEEEVLVTRIKHLNEIPFYATHPVNQNQTTIQDHIGDIADAHA